MSSEEIESKKRANDLIHTLKNQRVFGCALCQKILCFHQILFSIVMGYKNAPQCASCLAQEAEKNTLEFQEQLYRHIQQKSCWKMTWDWCSQQEGFINIRLPLCLWPESLPQKKQFSGVLDDSI